MIEAGIDALMGVSAEDLTTDFSIMPSLVREIYTEMEYRRPLRSRREPSATNAQEHD